MAFVIERINFDRNGSPDSIRFNFGSRSNQTYDLTIELPSDLDLKEAIAAAAENAMADLRSWAQEAEDLAASVRGGSLRTPET
jgi:hypothetical protein